MSQQRHIAKRFQPVFLIYWILVAYVFAALVWWFIALTRQNSEMAALKLRQSDSLHTAPDAEAIRSIRNYEQRKYSQ